MKTVDIKGKDYVMVNERIKHFRAEYHDHSLTSRIVKLEDGICVIKATVRDQNRHVVATGHAYEMEGSTFINKTSYIENCETSAWGRALGNLGIGIDTSIASSEEVGNAIAQQDTGKRSQARSKGTSGQKGTTAPTQRGGKQIKNPGAPASDKQIEFIKDKIRKLGVVQEDAQQFIDYVERSEKLTKSSASEIIDSPKEWVDAFRADQKATSIGGDPDDKDHNNPLLGLGDQQDVPWPDGPAEGR